MKRVVLCLSFVAATSSAAMASTAPAKHTAASHPATAHTVVKTMSKIRVAPADEYFGKMKMSILGIRNEIKDLGIKAEGDPAKADAIFAMASLTEDAMKDWERKYPNDTWLPKTVFALERMYNKVPTDGGRAHAKSAMLWLVGRYSKTWYGKVGRQELAAGKVGAPVVTAHAPATSAQTAEMPAEVPPVSSTPPPAAAPGSGIVGAGVSNGVVTLPSSLTATH